MPKPSRPDTFWGEAGEDVGQNIYDLVGSFLQFLIQNRPTDNPDDVINAFHLSAAQIGCAYEKEPEEVVAMQQAVYYKVKRMMIDEGTFGCGISGDLINLMRN